jgi:asparagine N-glycosylation enzyme membrane subunit Stt3
VLEGIKYKTAHLETKVKVAPLALIALASPIVIYKLAPEVVRNLITGYGMVRATHVFTQTIGELQPPSLEVLWGKYSILSNLVDFSNLPMPGVSTLLLVLFPLGLLFLVRDLYHWNWKTLFFGIWALASLFVFKTALRYAFLASIPLAILGALFLSRTEEKISNNRLLHLLPLAVILLIAVNGVTYASQQRPHMTPEWYEALNFLKTQEKGGVMTWWDYGSWIQGVAGFPTVVDTVAGQSIKRNKEIGLMFFETDHEKASKTVEKYNATYIVVPVDMIGQMSNINAIIGANHQYPISTYTGEAELGETPASVYGNFFVVHTAQGPVVIYKKEEKFFAVEKVYTRKKGKVVKIEYPEITLPIAEGGVYLSNEDLYIPQLPLKNFLIYLSPQVEDMLLTSLMLLEKTDKYKLIYRNPEVKIYKIEKW